MPNTHFQFKQFRVEQAQSGMKVTTDGCLFGAWVADKVHEMSVASVLDVGTGTGLHTLMLAQKIEAQFEAVEPNALAFEEARHNIAACQWAHRIRIHQAEIQSFASPSPFDLIICNPPFFHQNKKGVQAHRNAAIHNDSLSIVDLVKAIDRLLHPTGVAFVMYPAHEMQVFMAEARKWGIFPNVSVQVKDNPTGALIRVMGGFSREEKPIDEQQLIIKTPAGAYSREFTRLLRPYYLYLDES